MSDADRSPSLSQPSETTGAEPSRSGDHAQAHARQIVSKFRQTEDQIRMRLYGDMDGIERAAAHGRAVARRNHDERQERNFTETLERLMKLGLSQGQALALMHPTAAGETCTCGVNVPAGTHERLCPSYRGES